VTGRILLLGLWLVAGAVAAQGTVYRCGNEYSLTPCAQGKAVETQSSARSEAQRAEAVRVAASERQLADDMARDRRRAEAEHRPLGAGSLGPSRAASSAHGKAAPASKAKKKEKSKGSDGEDFVAVVPAAKS
jgi:hypothetical protein